MLTFQSHSKFRGCVRDPAGWVSDDKTAIADVASIAHHPVCHHQTTIIMRVLATFVAVCALFAVAMAADSNVVVGVMFVKAVLFCVPRQLVVLGWRSHVTILVVAVLVAGFVELCTATANCGGVLRMKERCCCRP